MKVFVCPFSGFRAVVPIRFISSLILCDQDAESLRRGDENGNVWLSLPHLFSRPLKTTRHGIVLKNNLHGGAEMWEDDFTEDSVEGGIVNRTILLVPGVEKEADIPSVEIQPMPKACLNYSSLFSGIHWMEGVPVFILDPRSLAGERAFLHHD